MMKHSTIDPTNNIQTTTTTTPKQKQNKKTKKYVYKTDPNQEINICAQYLLSTTNLYVQSPNM